MREHAIYSRPTMGERGEEGVFKISPVWVEDTSSWSHNRGIQNFFPPSGGFLIVDMDMYKHRVGGGGAKN